MSEIRVICPNCRTVYEIAASAIPPAGRDVECSNCGRVWRAELPSAAPNPAMELGVYSYNLDGLKDLADEYARIRRPGQNGTSPQPAENGDESQPDSATETPEVAEAPALNRRLPVSVLNILLDEVEHERRARQQEGSEPGALPPRRAFASAATEPARELPAITLTERAMDAAESADQAEAAPQAATDETRPIPKQNSATPSASLPAKASDPAAVTPSQGSYWVGFAAALAVATVLVGLYIGAPKQAESGTFGAFLIAMRDSVDQARAWLQVTVAGNGG